MEYSRLDSKEKILFTPGPLSTSLKVKQAMLNDMGSRDEDFAHLVRLIEEKLLTIAGCSNAEYAAILIPGSGTYGVESVLSSVIGPDDKLLIIENGAYGKRIELIAKAHGLRHEVVRFDEGAPIDPDVVSQRLAEGGLSHVAMVHCETSTGMLNPLLKIGIACKMFQAHLIVDAMSSFAGVPMDIPNIPIHYLISSSNKCIEGVPGFCFVIANIKELLRSEGKARTLGLDLLAQYRAFIHDGRFRFTPPTHVIAAFKVALELLEQEGGVVMRHKRYQENHAALTERMKKLGFKPYVKSEYQSPIITSFYYPQHPSFDFETLYHQLKYRGFLIYQGKLSEADCFRIGTIGHIFPHDIDNLVSAIARVCESMSIPLPLMDHGV